MAFAGPAFATGIMYGPGPGILAGMYAKYFGVSLAGLGTALLVGRLFDAITDPTIGFLSDKTKTRLGARKPWLIGGYAVYLLGMYFWFIPHMGVGAVYFLVWYLVTTFGWTMVEVPYLAWQAELSHDYKERVRIATFRVFSERCGRIAFSLFPLLPFFATTEITPEVIKALVVLAAVAIPILLLINIRWAPVGETLATSETGSFFAFLKTAVRNRPVLLLLGGQFFFGIAEGFYGVTLFLFVDTYLQEGAKLPYILFGSYAAAIVILPIALKIMQRIGKHQAWALGSALTVVVCLCTFAINPGPWAFAAVFALTVLIMFTFGVGQVAQPAILADVVDYDTLKTGQNRSGQYFALLNLVFKANFAVGGAIALFTLEVFGFDPTQALHDATATLGIKFAFGGLPAISIIIGIVFIVLFPLDKRRHDIIRRRLESLAARAARDASSTEARIAQEG
jgi:GPH family glycoside/pentoside/hexuronide:cation symporter